MMMIFPDRNISAQFARVNGESNIHAWQSIICTTQQMRKKRGNENGTAAYTRNQSVKLFAAQTTGGQ